jgi:DNA invertase Pin-like site-specific DNA recombinase
MAKPKPAPPRPQTGRVVGYIRVSTVDQELGPEAQRERLEEEAHRRGWRLEPAEDNGSGTTTRGRPGLAYALDLLSRGRADALVVTKLDRLARSIADFANILELSRAEGWALIVLDLGVDTGTPNGKLIANIVMSIAEWEAEMIALRTKEALAVKKLQGLQLGRPSTLPAAVLVRIAGERAAGRSLKAIADGLNTDQVPTSQKGRWHPSSVRFVLARAAIGPVPDFDNGLAQLRPSRPPSGPGRVRIRPAVHLVTGQGVVCQPDVDPDLMIPTDATVATCRKCLAGAGGGVAAG